MVGAPEDVAVNAGLDGSVLDAPVEADGRELSVNPTAIATRLTKNATTGHAPSGLRPVCPLVTRIGGGTAALGPRALLAKGMDAGCTETTATEGTGADANGPDATGPEAIVGGMGDSSVNSSAATSASFSRAVYGALSSVRRGTASSGMPSNVEWVLA